MGFAEADELLQRIHDAVEDEPDETDGEYGDHDSPQEWELPFWNSSQTNLPRPGFWASISAAISTIQPTRGKAQTGEDQLQEGWQNDLRHLRPG